jgi:hypothetical protein
MNHYSLIDYLCFTKALSCDKTEYGVIKDPTNFSDHLPVYQIITLPIDSKLSCYVKGGDLRKSETAIKNIPSKQSRLRWDHANLDYYYSLTGSLLYPIYDEIVSYVAYEGTDCLNKLNPVIDDSFKADIENLYVRSVQALLSASRSCIPCIPQHGLKSWWSSDLTEFKKKSIASHQLWLCSGEPKEGLLFQNKNKDKLNYKLAIKRCKKDADLAVSDQLHESLANKDSNCFWKIWKNKVCKQNSNQIKIEGNLPDSEAADRLAAHFQKTCSPNSAMFDYENKKEFARKLNEYTGDEL